jgi:tetratricopeptide (TPR) repeat protein
MHEVATYRLAKCYEMQGKREDAIDAYVDIVLGYEEQVSQGRLRDWFYFARSGYDAARLLELQGGRSNISRAIRVYERLARSDIPTAGEALKKAQELRKLNNLTD